MSQTSKNCSGGGALNILLHWRQGLKTLLLALLLAACSDDNQSTDLKLLRVAVLPDESRQQLLARHEPLVKHLAAALGVQYKLIIPDNYDHMNRIIDDDEADLAYFGGVTFVRGSVKNGVQALVMRDIDATFTSTFLVRTDSPASDVADLKSESMAFGSRLSTSGHLMPRFFLNKEGIVPEDYFSEVTYSGGHDKTAEWVRDGVVTLGIVNSRVVERMYDSGRLSPDVVRIVWKTPPFPDYVWAVRKEIPNELKERLRNAFLSLSLANPETRAILEKAHARGFLPAKNSDFDDLKKITRSLGYLETGL